MTNKIVKAIIIAAGAIISLCVCAVIVSIALPDRAPEEPASEEPAGEQVSAIETEPPIQPKATATNTEIPVPTETPEPTATRTITPTPRPTNTPEPTATPDPNLVEAGTYLVNDELQPGLFRGFAGEDIMSSCYWERMVSLSGDSDSILANDNAIGQYYVEVREGDMAFETDCDLYRVDLQNYVPAEVFPPEAIPPGSYLVNLDIQPGIYKGEAGADIMESCYWARLSNFSGDDDILDNDNATGQYYIEVQPGDFGLYTAC
jgi:hypothetical protein